MGFYGRIAQPGVKRPRVNQDQDNATRIKSRVQNERICTRDEVYGRKPQIQPEFRRRQRCLSDLKNRDVTGIAHDV